jgi:hypothetical protein
MLFSCLLDFLIIIIITRRLYGIINILGKIEGTSFFKGYFHLFPKKKKRNVFCYKNL